MKPKRILAVLLALFSPLVLGSCAKPAAEIYWYCAASMTKPAQEIVNLYNAREGKIFLITGGSGQLITKIESSQKADIFTPASDKFLKLAIEKKLAAEGKPLVDQKPVFALSPKFTNPATFDELWKKPIRIGIGNPRSMALGVTWQAITRDMPAEMREGFKKNAMIDPVNISQTVNYLQTGTIDAGLLFDSVARVNKFSYLEIPSRFNRIERASMMLLGGSSKRAESEKFIKFVYENMAIFEKHGFTPAR